MSNISVSSSTSSTSSSSSSSLSSSLDEERLRLFKELVSKTFPKFEKISESYKTQIKKTNLKNYIINESDESDDCKTKQRKLEVTSKLLIRRRAPSLPIITIPQRLEGILDKDCSPNSRIPSAPGPYGLTEEKIVEMRKETEEFIKLNLI
jgi:hypothetical protein